MRRSEPERQPTDSLRQAIIRYYEGTWNDYRRYWIADDDLALHFGFSDATTTSHHAALLNMNRVLADRAGVRPGQRVLDAGCGVGGSGIWLAKERDVDVVGITIVDAQIPLARKFASQHGVSDRVTFESADYTCTGFADGSFDVVWAIESLCYARDPLAFYRESFRLLRPGGRLIVADGMRMARPLSGRCEFLLREWARGWAVPDLSTPAEHASKAASAGFADVTVDDVSNNVRPSVRRLVVRSLVAYPGNAVRRALGRRSAIEHGNTVSVFRLAELLLREGALYVILCATRPIARRGAGATG